MIAHRRGANKRWNNVFLGEGPISAMFGYLGDFGNSHSMRTTRSLTLGNLSNTAGSWPGTISRGEDASCFIRSWARRLDAASRVWAIGTCFSRFSKRYMLSLARITVPALVFTPTYCDWKVCLPPV